MASHKTTAESFPARLRAARAARGLTQAALGEAAGVSDRTIRFYESGANAPGLNAIDALAKALGVHPATLVYGK